MRVAVDGRMILRTPTGIGRVTLNILRELAELDQHNQYCVLCRPGALAELAEVGQFHLIDFDVPQYSLSVFTRLPGVLSGERPDLIHFPYFFHPVFVCAPYIVTVFDTVYSHFSRGLSARERIAYQMMMRLSTSRARVVLTCSASAKSDVVKFFRVKESKIQVVPLAAESRFQPLPDTGLAGFKARYALPERYILYIGNHKPHKNVPALVQAFACIRADVAHYLVFLDSEDPHCRRTREEVEAAGIADRALFLPGFPDSDLPLLYNAAELFVFPSFCEGFGLPPLEAMACGTPVITSNASSLPEVVGEAGIMVDPHDVEGLAEAMLKVLGDPELRREMRAKGLAQAKKFSWKETARQTLNLYESVYNEVRG